jgi:hypothetical protein
MGEQANVDDRPGMVRPEIGVITRASGERVELRFAPTSDPQKFRPVDLDGNPVAFRVGDQFHVDKIGPGQSIDTSPAP